MLRLREAEGAWAGSSEVLKGGPRGPSLFFPDGGRTVF